VNSINAELRKTIATIRWLTTTVRLGIRTQRKKRKKEEKKGNKNKIQNAKYTLKKWKKT